MPIDGLLLLNLLVELQRPVGSFLDVRSEFDHHFASLVDLILGFFQLSISGVEPSRRQSRVRFAGCGARRAIHRGLAIHSAPR